LGASLPTIRMTNSISNQALRLYPKAIVSVGSESAIRDILGQNYLRVFQLN
jgi:hypothetical protein